MKSPVHPYEVGGCSDEDADEVKNHHVGCPCLELISYESLLIWLFISGVEQIALLRIPKGGSRKETSGNRRSARLICIIKKSDPPGALFYFTPYAYLSLFKNLKRNFIKNSV